MNNITQPHDFSSENEMHEIEKILNESEQIINGNLELNYEFDGGSPDD